MRTDNRRRRNYHSNPSKGRWLGSSKGGEKRPVPGEILKYHHTGHLDGSYTVLALSVKHSSALRQLVD